MKDAVKKGHSNVYTWGYDPDYTQVYLEKFIQFDPFTTGQFFFDLDEPVALADIVPHAEFRESRFFKEWGDGSVVSAVGGKLTVRDQTLSFVGAGGDDVMAGTKSACLPLRGRSGDEYVAHILSLTAGNRRQAGAAYSANAAVFVRKAELELPHPVEALAKRYGLTAAEMRVLFAIVESGGVPEVARMLGVSQATVKTHLQRIFSKTNTARQADLVKLIASLAGPFG